jgi:hypothetical protein
MNQSNYGLTMVDDNGAIGDKLRLTDFSQLLQIVYFFLVNTKYGLEEVNMAIALLEVKAHKKYLKS